jgi:predicted nucleic acid-binding protein
VPLFVLDTSAILCFLNREDGFERVREIIDSARDPSRMDRSETLIPFVAVMELEYLLLRRFSAVRTDQTLSLVENWPAVVVESDVTWRRAAAALKARTPLSVADAWIASLAQLRSGILVHKDPEYDQAPELQVVRLPYRRSGP